LLGGPYPPESTGVALPFWGASGLAVTGLIFALAGFLGAQALRPTSLAPPGLLPRDLLLAGLDQLPAGRAYLALAFEMDELVVANASRTHLAARRLERMVTLACAAPLTGFAAALFTFATMEKPATALAAAGILIFGIAVARMARPG